MYTDMYVVYFPIFVTSLQEGTSIQMCSGVCAHECVSEREWVIKIMDLSENTVIIPVQLLLYHHS